MMPANSEIIISDTSCLILLDKIGELDLLKKNAHKVLITSIIRDEYGKPLPEWIEVINPTNTRYQKILMLDLDEGEASAIALSIELKNVVLLLDDLKGRKVATRLGLRYSGTFGLVIQAKRSGSIKSVVPIINKIRSTNFRFSEELFAEVLRQAGEVM